MEQKNKQLSQISEQDLDQLEDHLLESELSDEQAYGLDQSFESAQADQVEAGIEKDSFFVRAKLGRLALNVASGEAEQAVR